ncbi:MAG: sialidase, partial [Planctomycetota bacterium]
MAFAPLSIFLFAVLEAPRADFPADLAPHFKPPAELAGAMGKHKSPLVFDNGNPVKTPADWARRREEIKAYWHGMMGAWPPIIAKPAVEHLDKQMIDGVAVTRIRIETAPGRHVSDAYLLKPASGSGPFPAAVVVYYEAGTGIGKGKEPLRDYAIQLARRGFVTLSLGGDPNT